MTYARSLVSAASVAGMAGGAIAAAPGTRPAMVVVGPVARAPPLTSQTKAYAPEPTSACSGRVVPGPIPSMSA